MGKLSLKCDKQTGTSSETAWNIKTALLFDNTCKISLPGTWVRAQRSLLQVQKINTCHDDLTYHSSNEHNKIRPKFRWASFALGTSYGSLQHRSCRQKQGTNGKQKHMLPFSPTLGHTHVLNTDVDPSTTWCFYQACKDLVIINLMK